MIQVAKTRKKLLIFSIFSTLILLSAYLVNAQFFADSYVVRTVHVFPSQIEAKGWNNPETLTFQNLKEYALIQEFNEINSATIDPARVNLLSEDETQISEASAEDLEVEPNAESASSSEVVTSPEASTSTDELLEAGSAEQVAEPKTLLGTTSTTTVKKVDFSLSLPEVIINSFKPSQATQTTT
ncbi:hypothetical protein KC926_02065, partial [Candidatus Kaiserbacteria bacterium]|nr:hypothetical protein [Candidatus Kaiserbacteria bacterium]